MSSTYPQSKRWGANVPLIGKGLAKYGRVGQMMASPCAPEPELWVKAFWVGAAHAAWSLAKPTAMTEHGSPLSEVGFGSHGRKGPEKERGQRYGWTGELMPGPEFQWPQGDGWAMWKIPFFLARQVGWYLLVWDALADGAVNWSSTALKWAGCPVPSKPYFWGQSGNILSPPNSIGEPGPYKKTGGFGGITISGGRTNVPANGTYTASLSVVSQPWPVLPGEFQALSGRIVNETSGAVFNGSDPVQSPNGTFGSFAVARAQQAGAGIETLRYEIVSPGGWATYENTTAYIQSFAFDNLLADP